MHPAAPQLRTLRLADNPALESLQLVYLLVSAGIALAMSQWWLIFRWLRDFRHVYQGEAGLNVLPDSTLAAFHLFNALFVLSGLVAVRAMKRQARWLRFLYLLIFLINMVAWGAFNMLQHVGVVAGAENSRVPVKKQIQRAPLARPVVK